MHPRATTFGLGYDETKWKMFVGSSNSPKNLTRPETSSSHNSPLLQIHFRPDQPQIEQPLGVFVESQRPQAYRRGSNGGDEGERVNERGEERGASDAGKWHQTSGEITATALGFFEGGCREEDMIFFARSIFYLEGETTIGVPIYQIYFWFFWNFSIRK